VISVDIASVSVFVDIREEVINAQEGDKNWTVPLMYLLTDVCKIHNFIFTFHITNKYNIKIYI
jgi:hypothetical protein